MYRQLFYILWFAYVFSPKIVCGQQQLPSSKHAQKLYVEAKKWLDKQAYTQAEQTLEELLKEDSTFVVAHQQLADIYLLQKRYANAAPHYELVSRLAPTLTPATWFGLGESLLHLGQYAKAKQALNTYLNKSSDSTKKTLARKYIIDCDFSLQVVVRPLAFQITNMGSQINSQADEYFPMLTADKTSILFTRQEKKHLEYIFSSEQASGTWTLATPIPGEVNTDQYSEGAHCISPDGKYLFFTGCNKPQGYGSCDIYVAYWDGKAWGKPYNLAAPINSGAWEAQPAISPDGRTLYFVSNRKGGYGGNDIWYSTLQADGKWSAPKNMGPLINTAFDESTPFIHADNETLYFASNGWPGFGDKDLFISRLGSDGKRMPPMNLGAPINDYLEQRALTVSLDGKMAYFAAERTNGLGGLDIYSCLLDSSIRPHPVAFVKGRVFDKQSGKAVKATVLLKNLTNHQVVFRSEADYTDGTFLVPLPIGNAYALHVQQPNYLFYSQHFALSDTLVSYSIYPIEVPLETMELGSSSTLNNIFFPTNGYELLPTSTADLKELIDFMQEHKQLKIEIEGHTDNTGNEQQNQILSEKRALAVYQYLISHGIEKGRLTFKGYGQSKPIASNQTEAGKQQNRRTAFKIISTTI